MAAASYYENLVRADEPSFAKHVALPAEAQLKAGLLVRSAADARAYSETIQGHLGTVGLGLLAGGPPCQGFSTAGKRGEADERNRLVWAFLDYVEELAPRFVLMENVPAIQTRVEGGNGADTLSELTFALRGAGALQGSPGYVVHRLLLRAEDFGVPQRRRRVFLVGVRRDVAEAVGAGIESSWDSEHSLQPSALAATEGRAAPGGAEDAIWDLTGPRYRSIESAPSSAARDFAMWARSSKDSAPPGGSCCWSPAAKGQKPSNHEFRRHTDDVTLRFAFLRLLAEYGLPRDLFRKAAESDRDIRSDVADLAEHLPLRVNGSVFGTAAELETRVRALASRKTTQRVLSRSQPAPTVTSLPDDIVHYAANRVLTVREMARLQALPDSFVFRGKPTTGGNRRRREVPQYTQVANAVPPPLGLAIGTRASCA